MNISLYFLFIDAHFFSLSLPVKLIAFVGLKYVSFSDG